MSEIIYYIFFINKIKNLRYQIILIRREIG